MTTTHIKDEKPKFEDPFNFSEYINKNILKIYRCDGDTIRSRCNMRAVDHDREGEAEAKALQDRDI